MIFMINNEDFKRKEMAIRNYICLKDSSWNNKTNSTSNNQNIIDLWASKFTEEIEQVVQNSPHSAVFLQN